MSSHDDKKRPREGAVYAIHDPWDNTVTGYIKTMLPGGTAARSEIAPKVDPHQFAPEETDKLLLGAWTGFENPYPQYFNATMVRMKGHVILSMRLHGGACSSVRFTREAWNEFAKEFEAMNRKYQAADDLDAIL